jgi:hypothetical protein
MKQSYEIHPPNLEDFFQLLDRREEEDIRGKERPTPRRAVYVSGLSKPISSTAGVPAFSRWVQAQFIYGGDLVTYKRVVASGYELHAGDGPSPEKQRWEERYQELKAQTEGWLGMHPDVPLLEMHITKLDDKEGE